MGFSTGHQRIRTLALPRRACTRHAAVHGFKGGVLIFVAFFQVASAGGGSSGASCSASGSGGRRLAGGAAWYCEDWERDYLEAVSSIVMVLVAVVFEILYHRLFHLAEHSFTYGETLLTEEERHEKHNRQSFVKPLRLMVMSRMGGEFMVLGFLAFTIWTCNQQGLFDALAKIDTSIRLPKTGSDYLHAMEDVHMQLFVSMILYFALVFRVVIGCDHRIQEFELARSTWIQQLIDGTGDALDTDPPYLRSFKLWRGHFLRGCIPEVLRWRESKPKEFQRIMVCLKVGKSFDVLTLADLESSFTSRFSFCTYVVYSLCHSVVEVIDLSHYAMLCIIIIKGFYGIMHRAAHVPLSALSPIFSCLCMFFILFLYYLTRSFKMSLERPSSRPVKQLAWLPTLVKWCAERFNPETSILTSLQVLLFFMCHSWAGNMISKDYWNGIFKSGDVGKIITAFVYIPSLCTLAVVLPRCVPDFAAIMSLPPFFSHRNEQVLETVAVQVVDAEMVRAREVVKKRQEAASPDGSKSPKLMPFDALEDDDESDDGETAVMSGGKVEHSVQPAEGVAHSVLSEPALDVAETSADPKLSLPATVIVCKARSSDTRDHNDTKTHGIDESASTSITASGGSSPLAKDQSGKPDPEATSVNVPSTNMQARKRGKKVKPAAKNC